MNGISTNVYTNPSPSAFADTKEPSRCNDAQVATTFTTDAIVDDTSMIVEAETVHEANETFAWCFTRQHDSLILVSGLLLYPFYVMSYLPPIEAFRLLRIIGRIVLYLDFTCLWNSVVMRTHITKVIRRGDSHYLTKNVAGIQLGYKGQEAQILVQYPFYLMIVAILGFCIEFMGYLWVSTTPGMELENPPLDVVELAVLYTFFLSSLVPQYRFGKLTRSLGTQEEPEESRLLQTDLVQEKV